MVGVDLRVVTDDKQKDEPLTNINEQFTGPITSSDTISFVEGNTLMLKGVKSLSGIDYLERSSISPRTIRRTWIGDPSEIDTGEDGGDDEDEFLGNGVELPKAFSLYPAYPNPFNPSTTIRFDLPERSEVSRVVHDVVGQKVAVLSDAREFDAGTCQVLFDGSSLASGVYFYRITVRTDHDVLSEGNKFVLVR